MLTLSIQCVRDTKNMTHAHHTVRLVNTRSDVFNACIVWMHAVRAAKGRKRSVCVRWAPKESHNIPSRSRAARPERTEQFSARLENGAAPLRRRENGTASSALLKNVSETSQKFSIQTQCGFTRRATRCASSFFWEFIEKNTWKLDYYTHNLNWRLLRNFSSENQGVLWLFFVILSFKAVSLLIHLFFGK